MDHTIVGVFDTPAAATQARQELLGAGFANSDITVLSSENVPATTGSATSTPTIGEAGLAGFFRSLFGVGDTDQDVGLYAEAVRRGGYVLTVHAADETQLRQAEDIMQRYGTVDVESRAAQWREQGWNGIAADEAAAQRKTTRTGIAFDSPSAFDAEAAEAAVPSVAAVQEELRVGKRVVRRGGVRVFSRVVETPVQETVNLREEHATVQRRAVDRPANEADFAAMQSGTIEVRETAEEVVVAKSARVVEEIEVDKQITEHAETVRDTVRHTEVQVERLGHERIAASADSSGNASPGSMDEGSNRPS